MAKKVTTKKKTTKKAVEKKEKPKNRILEFFKKYYKRILIGVGILVVITLIVLCVILFPKKEKTPVSNEDELIGYLEELGREWYETYYYETCANTDEERIAFVKKYIPSGITSSLYNMWIVNKKHQDDFVNALTDEECNARESIVRIIPTEPYGAKDYDIKVTLVCGFDKEVSSEEK